MTRACRSRLSRVRRPAQLASRTPSSTFLLDSRASLTTLALNDPIDRTLQRRHVQLAVAPLSEATRQRHVEADHGVGGAGVRGGGVERAQLAAAEVRIHVATGE